MTSRIANSAVSVPKRSLLMASLATFERQRLVLGIQRLSQNKRKLLRITVVKNYESNYKHINY